MTDPGHEPTARADLDDTARLLHEVFPIAKFEDARYLEWFYRRNPTGAAIEIDRVEDDLRLGHVGGIPQEYHSTATTRMSVFPLNLAVAESGRGRGLMTEMNEACFEEARRRYGIDMMVAMPNAASTRGYTGRLRFRLVGPLPVVLCPPVWPSTVVVESHHVTADYLASPGFDRLAESLSYAPGPALSHRWTAALLRWRLASPASSYAVHASDRAVIVTTVERRAGIPVAVVVKTFRRGEPGRVDANGVVAAACRFHRAPVALYGGFSAATRIIGVPLPDRLRPAPLNLCVRRFDDRDDSPDPRLDTFEMFDFDPF
ncbi:MAG TPA: hypothetical protein VH062_27085 [Polyangiaceae bacterium]|jgi:hypothetical protein|nr:hypothetical protein [Polyangiaceae bacterium]